MVIEKEDQEKNEGRGSNKYSPSSIHCIRAMFYKATSTKQDDSRATSELIGMGQVGSFRHSVIQDA